MENLEMRGRHTMLWLYHRGKNVAETTKIICATYGEDSLTEDACHAWFKRFDAGNLYLKLERNSKMMKDNEKMENKSMVTYYQKGLLSKNSQMN